MTNYKDLKCAVCGKSNIKYPAQKYCCDECREIGYTKQHIKKLTSNLNKLMDAVKRTK